jgi:hypothetical protein
MSETPGGGNQHLKPHQFKPGQSGNPAGRPKGSRNKLGEAFLDDAYEAWTKHGKKTFEQMAIRDPSGFNKLMGSILPREVVLNHFSRIEQHVSIFENFNLSAAKEFAEAYRLALATIKAKPPVPPVIDHLSPEAEAAWRTEDD